MSLQSSLARVFFGKHAEDCVRLQELWDRATMRWVKSQPKVGDTISEKGFQKWLTCFELIEYNSRKMMFENYWRKQREMSGKKEARI